MPGPEVAVKARAPFQLRRAPCRSRELVLGLDEGEVAAPVSGSTRSLSAKLLNASISEVDGVIGYQPATVAPAYTHRAGGGVAVDHDVAAVLSIFSTRSGSGQLKFCFA
jgi:hypothetical protein